VRRAVTLATLTLLLLRITGITLARESTIGSERDSLTESTIQDTTATITGESTATTVWQGTGTADKGSAQESTIQDRSEPAAGSITEDSTVPEADELEVTEEVATEAEGKNIGKPEGVGKPMGVGGRPEGSGKAKDDEGEANGGGGQQKITLCHKGKKTLTIGAPAQDAHLRHGDTLGVCQSAGAKPEPADETLGQGAAHNGDGGGGQQKVTLCHKGKKTLTVGAPAQSAHLRHRDTRGPCVGQ
jgi:hypothetical protein